MFLFFFFQAEDGIRDVAVTGVQTCALPISGSNASVNGTMVSYLFGPRLNLRKFDYFVPFAHFLLGGAHSGTEMTGAGRQSSFAIAAGGGVDMVLTKYLAWRVAQLDYFMTNFSGPAVGGNEI